MKKEEYTTTFISGLTVLVFSVGMLYATVFLIPGMLEAYYNEVFRSSSWKTDWLFYAHPFVLTIALKWVWNRNRNLFKGSVLVQALTLGITYTLIALVPVMILTFSAIEISLLMVITWILYGFAQATVAGVVFAFRSKKP
ncbi:MAG: hypothetical protein HRU69_11635 [Flammeovirgaceae bacterium]|nr:MAG: hypothetical protein HRU69_11635 [Flammeovirgaceae bacterium]